MAAGGAGETGDDPSFYLETGRMLRALRQQQGLSLVALGQASGLSPSFLSQMERGLVRASFLSLNRVARALGTTTQAVMQMRAEERVSVVRSHEGGVFDDARLLVRGARPLRVMEFTESPEEFGDLYEHRDEEVFYVADGVIEVETHTEAGGNGPGERTLLGAGEALYLASGVGHRWRRVGGGRLRVVLVSQNANAPAPLVEG